jgi:hypothetical protein
VCRARDVAQSRFSIAEVTAVEEGSEGKVLVNAEIVHMDLRFTVTQLIGEGLPVESVGQLLRQSICRSLPRPRRPAYPRQFG